MLRIWILKLVGTAMVSACAVALCPEGRAKRAVKLACGAASVIALLSITADFDLDQYASYLAQYRTRAESITRRAENDANAMTRFSIEKECEAYILDKASDLGITDIEVSVVCAWDDGGMWYPVRAELSGNISEEAQINLGRYLETELGIPAEKQMWRAKE